MQPPPPFSGEAGFGMCSAVTIFQTIVKSPFSRGKYCVNNYTHLQEIMQQLSAEFPNFFAEKPIIPLP